MCIAICCLDTDHNCPAYQLTLLYEQVIHLGAFEMSTAVSNETFSFDNIEPLLDALLNSENPVSFCRAIVHNGLPFDGIQGCHLFFLNNSSNLALVSGYGKQTEFLSDEISAWEDNALSKSVRTKTEVFDASGETGSSLMSIPLLRDKIPVGCLVLVFPVEVKTNPIDERLMPLISKLGAHALGGVQLIDGKSSSTEISGDELSYRQIEILKLMDKGMVNAQIAAELIVSESTIRQESVRIYRALGVPNRAEAARKALTLGIIRRPNLYTVE